MNPRIAQPSVLLLVLVVLAGTAGCEAPPPEAESAAPAATPGAAGEPAESVAGTEYELVAVIERGPRGPEDAVADLGRAIDRLEARREGATGAERRRLERSIDHLRSLELELAGSAAAEPAGSVLARAYAGLARIALGESRAAQRRGEPIEAAAELRGAVDHLARSLSAAERVDAEARATLVEGRELALEVEREGLGVLDVGGETLDELLRLAAAAESSARRPEGR